MLLLSGIAENTIKLVVLLIVFILIIVACIFVTRFVGTSQMGKMKNSNFKILDMYRLGQNQCLMIVEVGKRYFCIGASKDNISTICELSEDDIKLPEATEKSFSKVFASMLSKQKSVEKETIVTESIVTESIDSEMATAEDDISKDENENKN